MSSDVTEKNLNHGRDKIRDDEVGGEGVGTRVGNRRILERKDQELLKKKELVGNKDNYEEFDIEDSTAVIDSDIPAYKPHVQHNPKGEPILLDSYFTEYHCRSLDLLKTFSILNDLNDYKVIKPLPVLTTLKNDLDDNLNLRVEVINQVSQVTNRPIDNYVNVNNNTLNCDITEYFNTVNKTLIDLEDRTTDVSDRDDNAAWFKAAFELKTGVPDVPVSVKGACDKWLELYNARLVQDSFKLVMLPSLGIFSLLTIILYFISMFTDKEHLQKAKKSATNLTTNLKKSVRHSMRTPAKSTGRHLQSSSGEPLNSHHGNLSEQQILNDSSTSNNEICSTNINDTMLCGSNSGRSNGSEG